MSGNQTCEEMVSGQLESSSHHRSGCSDGGGGDRDGEGTLAAGLSSDSVHPPLASDQFLKRSLNAEDETPNPNRVSTVPDASAGLVPATLNGAASLNNSRSHVLPPPHEAPDAPATMVNEKLDNMEVDSETDDIPIAALRRARKGRGNDKVIDVPSEDEELEIIGVNEAVVSKPKKMPVVSCVGWRTRLSRGKQERVSYSTYFQKISDDSGDEKDDDMRDEDVVEEEEEESTSSGEEFDKSEPDVDIDDDMLIGDWQERYRAVKRKIMESDEGRDGAGLLGPELDGFMPSLPAKKLKPDNPDEVHVIESDLETDFDPDRGVLRSASSDSDWEEEIRYVPSSVGGGSSAGFSVTSNGSGTYRSKTPGSKSFPRPYRQRVKKDGSGSRFRSSKRDKRSSTRGRGPRGQDLMRMLVDRMSGEKGSGNWTVDPNQYGLKDVLPMLFSFEEELEEREKEELEEREKKKLEEDRELDELWADYEFALESENIGRYRNDEVLNVDEGAVWDQTSDIDGYCPKGQHDLILDEQIGVICKNCPFVSIEIRYILPAMATSMVDKSAWRVSTSEPRIPLQYTNLCANGETSEAKLCYNTLNGTVWDLIPGILSTMYAHQREAMEFMWNNLAGGIELDPLRSGPCTDVLGGCVVCHAPGTGKTRLAIVFIQTYMKVFPDCRPVIIAPRGMLYTWEEEFKKWNINIPFHILNTSEYTGKEDSEIRKLVRNERRSEKLTRLVKLCSWDKGSGVLGVSYGLFTKLTLDRCKTEEDAKVRKVLLERPGLLVLDEGHTPRNARSFLWKTLGKVKSEKRIILSGTPFQNNFMELYNILCLVRPQFAERFLIKRPKRGRHRSLDPNEAKGIWNSITSNVTDDNAEEIRSVLKPFVHIHTGNILRMLPGLRECVIILSPSSYQKDVIKKVESIGTGCNFETEYNISLASIHPSLVAALKMTEEEALFVDKQQLEKYRLDPNEGVKTKFVIEVVRLCEALKEKVLIFSQFIEPLLLIRTHLIKLFQWREGKEILHMDGKILPRYRQASIDIFNDPDSDARVLLASTRACCEGISLTGASRVVLLDVVWNPAVGRQAISRAYRIGQRKFVYTYNLITSGTSEVDKYDRQAEKDHLSKLVFAPETDLNNVRNTLTKAEESQSSELVAQDKILSTMTSHRNLQDMFSKIYYPRTESNIVYTYNQVAPV